VETGGNMATDASYAQYIKDQISGLGRVEVNKMFGEYGVYLDGKFVALLCDNVFYLKHIPDVIVHLTEVLEAPPYKGAKPWYVIEQTDDREYLQQIVLITYRALPEPKPKKEKQSKQYL
jgi:TfoX/Sxy family transcriptional regulator of competence genes